MRVSLGRLVEAIVADVSHVPMSDLVVSSLPEDGGTTSSASLCRIFCGNRCSAGFFAGRVAEIVRDETWWEAAVLLSLL